MVTGEKNRSGRREDNRYSRRILSRVKVLFGPDAPQALGFALNLSANGLYLSSTKILPPRTELFLRMEPLGEDAIDLRGRVRWGQRIPPSLVSVA